MILTGFNKEADILDDVNAHEEADKVREMKIEVSG